MSNHILFNYGCLGVQIFVFAGLSLFVESLRMKLVDRENINAADMEEE